MRGKIHLEGLEFHAYHGVYPHERSSGNKFEVDVLVETEIGSEAFQDKLSGTINYEDLYSVVKAVMGQPVNLLEKAGHDMAQAILHQFESAKAVEIKIAKFNPPIGGVCRKAIVIVNEKK